MKKILCTAALSLATLITACGSTISVARITIAHNGDTCYIGAKLTNGAEYRENLPKGICDTIPFNGTLSIDIPEQK